MHLLLPTASGPATLHRQKVIGFLDLSGEEARQSLLVRIRAQQQFRDQVQGAWASPPPLRPGFAFWPKQRHGAKPAWMQAAAPRLWGEDRGPFLMRDAEAPEHKQLDIQGGESWEGARYSWHVYATRTAARTETLPLLPRHFLEVASWELPPKEVEMLFREVMGEWPLEALLWLEGDPAAPFGETRRRPSRPPLLQGDLLALASSPDPQTRMAAFRLLGRTVEAKGGHAPSRSRTR